MNACTVTAEDGTYHVIADCASEGGFLVNVFPADGCTRIAGPVLVVDLAGLRSIVDRISEHGTLTIAALQEISRDQAWERREVAA